MTKRYLKGTIDHLNVDEAAKYPQDENTIHHLEEDGTITVIELSDKPVQKDQLPFKKVYGK